ncbi:POZ domain-containing protein [Rhizophagus irregularis]|uniref:POZ domain-containing protein n=4 Tax=Rhizophagus irregularis TaxID=588596 RepID=A0A2I1E9X3_9GLOM|nr:hypothetical protein RirG_081940 [Rhizophagus irregularis DAOM 197198w]PKC11217.1 POZ domain-containing protein [Rhizophagus irregularis]GBC39845.2 BTB/POZ protein [Rhizophagus irregularis DAOM 181602=DAOM 197198]PKK77214.1 POZ domain-containing protein [Rhizophagus irregularis]PKY18883.1 POZ domain-containing protein [Rhizophagus irregularis]
MGSNDERIILNVGGIKYETNRSTLTKYPETYLGTIFGENFKRQKKDNEYFFDRNGYAFRYILEYHRTGQILWAPSNDSGLCNGVSLKEMVLEFEFFKIPNELNEDHDDKEYDLNEIRDLFKELSVTSFPSKTLNDSKNESLSINNPPSTIGDDRRNLVTTGTQSHYPNTQYPQHSNTSQHSNISQNSQYHNPVSQTYSSTPNINNTNNNVEMGRLRRWATVEEHVQLLDSFVMALSSIVFEIYHNLRRQINIYFHSRLILNQGKDNQHSSSIEFDLDLDRIKEIMKPFKACGVKLLEWYGNEIVKKLMVDFNEAVEIKISRSGSIFIVTITILIQFNNQYIYSKSSLMRR